MMAYTRHKIFRVLTITVLLADFLVPFSAGWAEDNTEAICEWDKIKEKPAGISVEEYRSLLKKCQDYYQQKSDEIEKDIQKTAHQKSSLKNEIWTLQSKIKNLSYKISQSNIMISGLSSQIKSTEESIQKIEDRIEQVRGRLADLIQLRYEKDQQSILEVFLARQNFSDMFDDLMALDALNSGTQELLKNIKDLKLDLQSQKQEMSGEKEELERLVSIQALQKEESAAQKKKQEYFLQITESDYQNYLQKKQEAEKKASEIAARIYELVGVRKAVTYEEALKVAKYAASQVGIRPALLLGILSQESALGKNVGQCYLKNPRTGAGIVVSSGKSISRVMKPTRDVGPFQKIIEDLNKRGMNLDPYKTLVSCPMSFGWGGAMGPAQFMPSTWVNAGYKARVEKITGRSSDPWDITDASLAASLYLKDKINKYGTEGAAARAYFCGSPRTTYWCRWYEKNVLYLASCHQTFIDKGRMSEDCQNAIGLGR